MRIAREDAGISDESDDESQLKPPPSNIQSPQPNHPQVIQPPIQNCTNTPAASSLSKKARRFKLRRAKRRAEDQDKAKTSLKAASLRHRVRSKTTELTMELDTAHLPATTTGWTGVRQEDRMALYGLDELLGPRFKMSYVDWDGM